MSPYYGTPYKFPLVLNKLGDDMIILTLYIHTYTKNHGKEISYREVRYINLL